MKFKAKVRAAKSKMLWVRDRSKILAQAQLPNVKKQQLGTKNQGRSRRPGYEMCTGKVLFAE